MNAPLKLEASIHARTDKTREFYVQYTPVLVGGALATGELRFASWQCRLLAGPELHEQAMRDALDSARNAIATMAREVA